MGYPGESEADFEELKQWVKEMRFERLGCFTYSHENTHAFQLEDDVPEEEKQRRSSEIMEVQAQISWELNQEKVRQTYRCIIDRKEGNYFVGRTEMDSPMWTMKSWSMQKNITSNKESLFSLKLPKLPILIYMQSLLLRHGQLRRFVDFWQRT